MDDEIRQDFPNWRKFREVQLEHGIQCHSYEHDKAIENEHLEKVTFLIKSNSRDEYKEETAWLVKPEF